MPPKSRTPFTILGCLTVEPMSGYDIKHFVDGSIVHFWSESYGQIYPTLATLEQEGLIEGRCEPGERGRDKRVYRITGAGREALEAWLREPAKPTRPRHEHSLKLFFGYNAGLDVTLEHLRHLRERTEETLARYEEAEGRLAGRMEGEPDSRTPYWLIVLRGGIRYSRMVLEWCDESAETLHSVRSEAAGDEGAG
ncbi:MAG: PadR family transcriptional regulator [Gemmatimonadota bacterium]|jgi:DNA-binding PadR family transcriptional regulator